MSKINAQRQTKEDITDLQNEISEIKELLITRNSPTVYIIIPEYHNGFFGLNSA